MTTPSTDWPRTYLFQIHDEAIKHGVIFIEGISREDARSLAGRLYRIRRRSDKAMAGYIPPDYNLVTVGEYQAAERRLPIIYNRLPSGDPLPRIRAASGEELEAMYTPRQVDPLPPPDAIPLDAFSNVQIEPLSEGEIDSFVGDLIRQAGNE